MSLKNKMKSLLEFARKKGYKVTKKSDGTVILHTHDDRKVLTVTVTEEVRPTEIHKTNDIDEPSKKTTKEKKADYNFKIVATKKTDKEIETEIAQELGLQQNFLGQVKIKIFNKYRWMPPSMAQELKHSKQEMTIQKEQTAKKLQVKSDLLVVN